jgi:Right handed beta helix region
MTYRGIGWLGLAVALTWSAGVVNPAWAAKLVVAANGTDGDACGDATSPCRSINRAIANAAAGDTIEVGPGRYGDLNRDGDFDDPGDEVPATCLPVVCMVDVVKPVTIVSRRGASVTLLDARHSSSSVVRVAASGAVFGKKSKGFTVTGGNSEGILLDGGSGVTIAGNTSLGSPTGFRIIGDDHTIDANRATDDNGVGFDFFGGEGHTVTRNAAVGNLGFGFNFFMTHALVTRNVASGNGTGIAVSVTGIFPFDGPRLLTNVVTDNVNAGVRFGPFSGSPSSIGPMTLMGNGTDGSNCGVRNESGGNIVTTSIFWGSPLGPGPDPADDVCNVSGSTTTIGIATTEVGFNLPAQR